MRPPASDRMVIAHDAREVLLFVRGVLFQGLDKVVNELHESVQERHTLFVGQFGEFIHSYFWFWVISSWKNIIVHHLAFCI